MTIERAQIERAENWRDAVDRMPYLSFPADWRVAVIPPFAGALARFLVMRSQSQVSVYADFHDALGCYGEPYWEIHPDITGDCERYPIADGEGLLAGIAASFDKQDADAMLAARAIAERTDHD